MPEFQMNGKEESEFTALPEMVQGFIEAMFFTESSCESSEDWFSDETQEGLREGTIDGCLPNDVGFAELHPDSLNAIIAFCVAFKLKAETLLQEAYERGYDETQAGRDLWYTSQGHGVGFWDREALEENGIGDKLSALCRYREANVWFADHVEYGNEPYVYCEISF